MGTRRLGALLLALIFIPALPWGARGAEPEENTGHATLTVTGEANITVEPDQAEIDIAVLTEAPTAAQAVRENSARHAKVIGEIKQTLNRKGEVKTIGFSVDPLYRRSRQEEKPEIAGYRVTHTLRVATTDLKGLGALIDTAMRSGANRIQRLVLTLKESQAAEEAALQAATTAGRAKAVAVARALGLKVTRVISAVENDRGFRPLTMEPATAQVRALGVPTANLALGRDTLRPAFGVYAVRVAIEESDGARWLPGVANLGVSPMYGYEEPLLKGFRAKYGADPHDLPNGEDRWVRFRAEPHIAFMRAVRKLIKPGIPLSVMVAHPWFYRGLRDKIDGNLRERQQHDAC